LASHSADLALSGLTKTYGETIAVDTVTFRIATGEMVALLGPSGCGKTTTLRMIAGLIEPSAGDIQIGGRSITNVPVHKRNIGMLFQNYALFPHLSVGQNIAFGLEMRGVRRAEAARRVKDALALVQLGHLGDRLPTSLSGGQQQRVALARALVIEPSVMLLDEPLGALDKSLRESMQVELRQLQQRLGITTVIVTHDQEEALTLADRIVIMRAGRLEQIGTPQEIYSRPVSRFVAGFIGASNFLRGYVAGQEGGTALVALQGGSRLTVQSASAPPAGEVMVALRPEAISVQPFTGDHDTAVNATPATIEQIIYRGSLTHLYLRMDDGAPLLAFHQNRAGERAPADLSPGGRVIARWTEENNHLVADR
jgi:putative spermidine/putrescine transport system ATP-binding protein/spermidine/putrescine transport system ATP-binding protein